MPRHVASAVVVFSALACTSLFAGEPTLELALGGDVMFGRVTSDGYRTHDATGLQRSGDVLRRADVAFVNLESGICDAGRTDSALPLLWAPAARLDALGDAGVDVVSIANNHALDCGPDGVEGTRRALDARGIAAAGVRSSPAAVVSERVVVLAATMHPPPYHSDGETVLVHRRGDETLLRRVRSLREQHPRHALLVSLHWGRERSSKVAAWQRETARALVDAGANVIAGHGPHTPQRTERYRDAIIHYSLGNLAFDDRSPIGKPRPPETVVLMHTDSGWITK